MYRRTVMPNGRGAVRWALEEAPNPSVLRLHVDRELTDRTILACPPGTPPAPVDRLLEVEAIRSLDLHRYRVRVNLRPDGDRGEVARHVAEILTPPWGPAGALRLDAGPRGFEAATTGGRVVAESPEMAAAHPALASLFAVDGVSEAIVGEGLILVRLGRMFGWDEAEGEIAAAIRAAADQTGSGTPGSTSSPS